MANAEDIIKGALKKLGVYAAGETLNNDDLADALEALNDMLGSWSINGLNLLAETLINTSVAAGVGSITIGSGATWDTTRPTRIVGAYVRDSNGIDLPVRIIEDRSEYDRIIDKTITGRPRALFYDATYTTGTIYLDMVTDEAYTLFVVALIPLSNLALKTTTVSLPDEYKLALKTNLAVVLAPDYEKSISPELGAIAFESRSVLQRNNSKPVVARLSELSTGRTFNINTGL